ncbi:MAG: peptidoglycan recognition protein family protein [Planctomycetota bacterium]|jgi:hypothetical protein|nr:peptidoglycan recognition protein family protein [Planctomycetota bacterium]
MDRDVGGAAGREVSLPTRRDFLRLAGIGAAALLLPGCGQSASAFAPPSRPSRRPSRQAAYASPSPASLAEPPGQPQVVLLQPPPTEPQIQAQIAGRASGRMTAISRQTWGAADAIPGKMTPMNGVTRLTIHHEGSAKPNNDNSPAQVAATLRLIQGQHRKRMGAGDIGYHFIIDRTGAVWQGRDWKYQGAHASGANPHNLGIMLLGNFEIQQPTAQQLASLRLLSVSLARKYGLNPAADIFAHCDFGNTQCPGRNLKPQVASLRRA